MGGEGEMQVDERALGITVLQVWALIVFLQQMQTFQNTVQRQQAVALMCR